MLLREWGPKVIFLKWLLSTFAVAVVKCESLRIGLTHLTLSVESVRALMMRSVGFNVSPGRCAVICHAESAFWNEFVCIF